MVKLTSMVKASGCAAKLDPQKLHDALSRLPEMRNDRLLEGFESSDDALVYQVEGDTVAIETVDFFPPMVDDPYTFGQVAAANALSDIYAMGAVPAVAMNLLCFPSCLDISVMEQILRGGQDKVRESGAVIAGGHTISDAEPKYGLCVTAFANRNDVWSNKGAEIGDALVLTKPLGVGVIVTASKAEMIDSRYFDGAVQSMITLNKQARNAARSLSVHAATDVTGFSLLGHGMQMAQASGVSLRIQSRSIPFLPGALEAASYGLLPEGMYHNLDYVSPHVSFSSSLAQNVKDVLCDPQTSGGLLFSLPREDAEKLVASLPSAAIIGEIVPRGEKEIVID
ncbi:MAG: selenide, water dikinase SelD [Sphaerochaetaceae bacterium]